MVTAVARAEMAINGFKCDSHVRFLRASSDKD